MCGLAGIYNYGQPVPLSEDLGLRMIDTVSHRGPDDGGLFVSPRMLLGHRRLSILDLSSDGHQPMADESGKCWIVFNGEIYNFRELRKELQSAGHPFRSRTDTEVILHGYRQWGFGVVERLNGMFAFAIWDQRQELLWLVRDGLGIKPLFYQDDGRCLRFGSEIKAILADPAVLRRPCYQGLDQFLTFGYVAAPLTGFEGIRQLRPGESLTVRAGNVTTCCWYRLPYPSTPPSATIEECTQRLEDALDGSVASQMVSDVPLGALLSGGLDSSAVVRSMRRSTSDSLETFTIGFAETSFDESPYAATVAERYGTNHRSQIMGYDAADILRMVVSHAEEPLSDNSAIPFYLLSEHARRYVTVALSGDGADELLGGYMTYRATQWAPYYRNVPDVLRRKLIEPLVNRLPDSTQKYGLPMVLRRFVAAASRPFPWDHCSWRRIVSASLRSELYTPTFLNATDDEPLRCYAESLNDVPDSTTPLEKQLHMDLRFHLPNDMLVKVDRMSMAHGLEVRVPFLDQRVVAACLAMPSQCKRQGRRGKLPLRRLLTSDLGKGLVERRKAGFLIPLERLLNGPWRRLLDDSLTVEFAETTGMLDSTVLSRMREAHTRGRGDFAYPLFSLLVLAIWWKTWMTQTVGPCCRKAAFAPTRIRRADFSGVVQ